MRSKIFWKFFGVYLLILTLAQLVSFFFLKSFLVDNFTDQTSRHLDQIITLVRSSLDQADFAKWTPETVDPFIDRLSVGLEDRITIIDARGNVLGDSKVSEGALLGTSNHLDRPEIIQAAKEGYGRSIRHSSTLKKPMLYVARPYPRGFIRLAIPLSGLKNSTAELNKILRYGLFIGAAAAVVVAFFSARRFTRPIRGLQTAVQKMSAGDFDVRVPAKGSDEFASFSRSFNVLALQMRDLVENLSDEKSQLRVILDSMIEGVMVLDSNQQILLTNRAIEEIFSLEIDPEGRTPLELLRNPALQEVVKETLSGRRSEEREIQIQRGGAKQIIVHASPLAGAEGVEGSVLVFHDITHLRRLEKVRREFVANVSHELKTPLAAVKGYTETLLQGAMKDEENALKFLQVIDRHAERLNQIIQDLLDLSKIESAEYELCLEKIALAPVVEELKTTFFKVLEEKKISFSATLTNVESVWADSSALSQILSNLLDNAIKYSGPGGKVTLKVEVVQKDIRFSMEDDGPGISPEHLSRIFERFYRADQSRSRDLGGTGLGLSIVKHLVQLHGGEVKVESQWGHGSKFYFVLPQEGMI